MTPTPNPPALLPVIQADRVLVARFIRRYDISENGSRMARNVLDKNHDDSNAVQEAAAHRLQSTPAEPKVSREAVGRIIDPYFDQPGVRFPNGRKKEAFSKAEAILAALSNPPADGDGWRWVPPEITVEIEIAWRTTPGLDCASAYRAMLAAAPSPANLETGAGKMEGGEAPPLGSFVEQGQCNCSICLHIRRDKWVDRHNSTPAPPSAPLGAGGSEA